MRARIAGGFVFWSIGCRLTAVATSSLLALAFTGPARAETKPSPSTTTSPRSSASANSSAGDATYWTAQRMQAAVPVRPRTVTGPANPRHRAAATTGTSQGQFSGGIPEVGTFFVDTPSGDTTCTGSVVHSPGRDLVLSAGHCLYSWKSSSAHRIFVPQYTGGLDAAHQPYGFFPVESVFLDPRFTPQPTTSVITDLDFGFATTGTDDSGRLLEDVTGALTLTNTPGYVNTVTVMGYPSQSHNPGGQVWTCDVTTASLPAYHQMQMACPGFYGGTSGGPWITGYDPATHTGNVIGVIGGLYAGGDIDAVSYSPMFDQQIQQLYTDTVNGTISSRDTYQPTVAPGGLPGGNSVWKGARLFASGDYTGHHRSDLITVWSDGKVSLFPSDPSGGFDAEVVLTAANSRWRTARLITGGDFDGSDRFDLMVIWNDGSLSNFPDTGVGGLGTEKKYTGPTDASLNSAIQFTAGQFRTSSYVTDLVVLWTDGELTLYSGTGGGKLGTEHQLRKPSSTWQNATLLTSGQYNHSLPWDLMVHWVDGELDNYPAVSTQGMGAEHRVLNPNTNWRNAVAITTGHYTGKNAYVDDVLVRWTDGHTSLYPDTTLDHIGPDQPLTTTS